MRFVFGVCLLALAARTLADTWVWSEPSGHAPQPRFEHTANRIGGNLFVFGGTLSNDVREADLHVLNVESMKWSKPHTTGNRPGPTMGHSSVVLSDQMFVMFGSNGRSMSNRVFQLDTDTYEWTRIITHGRVPTARAYHSSVILDGEVYTFGGFDGSYYLNDLHKWTVFDAATNETGAWVKLEQKGTVPEVRASASVALYGRKMYLFGGFEVSIYKNDFFALDLDTHTWSRIHLTRATSCPMPGPRAMSSLTLVGTKLVLFGGIFCASNGTCVQLNDVHTYDIFKSEMRSLDAASGLIPPARNGHSATLFGSNVLVFGGAAWPNLYNDIFFYDLYDNHWTMAKNLPPYSRKQHTMHLYYPTPETPTVVTFGGKHGSKGYSQNVHLFDVASSRWSHPEPKGQVIPPVGHHSSLIKDNTTLVVFGGYDGLHSNADLYTADLETISWEKVETQGPSPSARHGHASALSTSGDMLVFGGVDCHGDDCTFFNDLYAFSFSSLSWSAVNTTGPLPPPRASHSLTCLQPNTLTLFGGIGPFFANHNDLYTFDEVSMVWKVVSDVRGAKPEARFGHTAAVYRDNLLIFGGGACRSVGDCWYYNDVFLYSPTARAWSLVTVHGNSPAPRLGAGAAMLGETLFILGGASTDRMFGEFISIQPDAPVPERTIIFGTGRDESIVGKNTRMFVQLQDSFGANRTTGGNHVQVHVTPRSRKAVYMLDGAKTEVFVDDLHSGVYRVQFSTPVADDYNVTVSVDGTEIPPFKTHIKADLPSPNNTRARGSGLSSCTAGEACEFTIELIDQFFNTVEYQSPVEVQFVGPKHMMKKDVNDQGNGKVVVTYTPEKIGLYKLHIRLRAMDVQESPFVVNVTANVPSEKTSLISGDALFKSVAGEVGRVNLTLLDAHENPIGQGGDIVNATLIGPEAVPCQIQDRNNGEYSITYIAYKRGTYTLTVSVNGKVLERCPFEVVVSPSAVSPATTFAYGTGLRYSVAGYRGYFTIQTADEFGNNITTGGTKPNVIFAGPGNYKQQCDITDHGDGTYSVSYTNNIAGDFLISATIFNKAQKAFQSIHLSPFLGSTVASGADPSKSYLYVRNPESPVFQGSATFKTVSGVHNYFYIQAVDRYGNRKTTGGDHFTATLDGPISQDGFVSDNGDGTYVGMYVAPSAGRFWLKVSYGNVAVNGTPIAVRARNNFDVCPNACSGRGECRNNLCSCHSGYSGTDCSTEIGNCPSNCLGNGACINSTCFCFPGFGGLSCEKTVTLCPKDCSGRGRCVNAHCMCKEGFDGEDCSKILEVCAGGCSGNGECVGGECLCYPGFSGADCATKGVLCPRGCSGKGTCSTTGLCACISGWTGLDCSTMVQMSLPTENAVKSKKENNGNDNERAFANALLPDRLPRKK